MIRNRESLSMAEAGEYLKGNDSASELAGFINKFVEIDAKKAKELRAKLQDLNLLKIKSEHISKVIDLLPENAEDLNKIFIDVRLDEDEIQKILDIVKHYR
ncbi:MAG TPA: hypothetical protein PLK34_00885 [Candidatus Pacearchaeota archaeon]|nr:hypothetical protein [Candidatus Pacearchaeota archaeon]